MRLTIALFFLISSFLSVRVFADEDNSQPESSPSPTIPDAFPTATEPENPDASPTATEPESPDASPTDTEPESPDASPTDTEPENPDASPPPQAVLITMDDMRPEDMRFMPKFIKYIKQNHGVDLPRAFVSCPLCCPSRATLMTGLYVSNHGVYGNQFPLLKQTIFETFKKSNPDIKTGLIGKYLNSFKGGHRPEFDEWVSYPGGMIYNWFNLKLNINGEDSVIDEYVSDYFLKRADDFVEKYINDPYLLYLHFTAPHFPSLTPKNFSFDCSQVKFPKRFNKIDKKAPLQYRLLGKLNPTARKQYICRRAASINYIDNIIVPFVDKLVKRGVKVIFISDNGFAIGEFRQWEKNLPYEQVSRTPFIAFNWDINRSRLTSLIDVAVNYYKLFNVKPPYHLDGIPYSKTRSSVMVENYKMKRKIPFTAIVDKKTIKVTYEGGFKQTIRLKKYTDLKNPIKKPGHMVQKTRRKKK